MGVSKQILGEYQKGHVSVSAKPLRIVGRSSFGSPRLVALKRRYFPKGIPAAKSNEI